jgi:hypothetical protein
LRHRLTLEIIEEHLLILPSAQHQTEAVNALQRRITLHHTSVPRLIYFRLSQEEAVCSQLGSQCKVAVYSEYRGDCLQEVAEEKGERLYHSSCQCMHILSAAHYLRERYGFFALTPSMIFLGTRKENISKVWINSRVELSHPEIPASEEEMCDSLCRLLLYVKNHRLCASTTNEHL